MPAIQLPTDAFQESAKKEFIESPHHERGDTEANITGGYAQTGMGVISCTHGKYGSVGSSGAAARGAYDEVFLRTRLVISYEDDPTYGGASSLTYSSGFNKWTGHPIADTNSGGPIANVLPYNVGYTEVSDVITTDTSTEVRRLVTYTNGTTNAYRETIDDQPYTHAQMVSDMLAIKTGKYAAWEVSGATTTDEWCYDDSGAIVSGYWDALIYGTPAGNAWHWTNGHTANFYAAKAKWATSPTVTGLKFKITLKKYDYGGSNTDGTPATSYLVTDPVAQNAVFIIGPDGTSTFNYVVLQPVAVSNIPI